MCDHHHTHAHGRAIALEHGEAHDRDHATWSRRDFLTRSAALAGGATLALNGMPVHATSNSSLLHALAQLDTERILVLIQLGGGNDGLNTLIPITNDVYYQRRPTLAIPANEAVSLNSDFGLHPAMQALQPLWGDGRMSVLHAVGYPDPSLSHFRSTDIWATGSRSDEVRLDGWTGRYLDTEFPDYVSSPPDYPVAIRIGGASELLVRGSQTALGMSFSDAYQIQQLADTGELYNEADVPNNPFGQELSFVRSIYNAALRYRDTVIAATETGTNEVEYPVGGLGDSLAAVAKLIKGDLGARIYVVTMSGFDTHAGQANDHANQLARLANAVAAFQADLSARSRDVLTMTFSEFGRRVEEDGSQGTDHGTAAPLFFFGESVNGGFVGDEADLVNLDDNGNLRYSTDFRSVYATILSRWFGLPFAATESILGESFPMLDFLANPAPVSNETVRPTAFVLEPAYPNPFREVATTAFAIDRPGPVTLSVFDVRGRMVARLADGPHLAGRHVVRFDGSALPSGTYLLRLDTPAGPHTQPITLVH